MSYSRSRFPLFVGLLSSLFLSFATAQIEYGEGLHRRKWYNYPCHANPSDITEPWGASIQGYGTCYDKNSTTGDYVGGSAGLWKICARVWVLDEKNKTFPGGIPDLKGEHKFVDMQCICHPFFNSDGEQCSILPSAQSAFIGQLLYVFVGIFNVYQSIKSIRLTYVLLVSKKWQLNPAIITLLWLVATTINEAARNLMVPAVNSGSTAFAPLSVYQLNIATLTCLPITVISLNFAFMGVSLTWLELAESASHGGISKGKSSSSKILWMRRGAKSLMILLAAIVLYLCGTNNTAKIPVVGIFFSPIMVFLNYLGGKKLRQLLLPVIPPGPPPSQAPRRRSFVILPGSLTRSPSTLMKAPKKKSFEIGECIHSTNRKILVDCGFFIIWTIVLPIALGRGYDVVDKDGRLFSLIAFSLLFVNTSIAGLCYTIYSYFEQSNRTTIEKMSTTRERSVTPLSPEGSRSRRNSGSISHEAAKRLKCDIEAPGTPAVSLVPLEKIDIN